LAAQRQKLDGFTGIELDPQYLAVANGRLIEAAAENGSDGFSKNKIC